MATFRDEVHAIVTEIYPDIQSKYNNIATVASGITAGKQLSTEDYTTVEKAKLSGIATGATANSSDSTLLNRANHTGIQSADSIVDGVTNVAMTKVERDKLANASMDGHTHTIGDVGGLQSQLNNKSDISHNHDSRYYSKSDSDTKYESVANKGVANGYAPLGADGKINPSFLSSLNTMDVFTPADQSSMLALTGAGIGDISYRQDNGNAYMLIALPASTLANWKQLNSASGVLSVNGLTGAVSMNTGDISEGTNKYYTDERVDDRVATLIQAGTNVSVVYDDALGTLTISANDTVVGIDEVTGLQIALDGKSNTSHNHDTSYAPLTHISDTSNPHSVTKAQVGLGNVDNTSDANKPISTATQTALNNKADKATTLAGYGITDAVNINDTTASTSTSYSSSKVDTLLNTKQNTLVSGTSIKTVNGTSVLGSGDITIAPVIGVRQTVQSATQVNGYPYFINSGSGLNANILATTSTGTDKSATVDILGDGSCKALYQFENNANDTSGSFNANLTNVTYSSSVKKFGSYSATFNGSTAYGTSSWSVNPSTTSFTVSAWFNSTTAKSTSIAGVAASNAHVHQIGINANGTVFIMVNDGTQSNASNTSVFDGVWHFVSAVFTPTISYLYLDGVLVATTTIAGYNGTCTYCLAGFGNATYYFNGNIDQARISNKALTATEITIVYTEGLFNKSNLIISSANGTTDRLGTVTADTTVGLSAYATNYIYADVASTGTVTLGAKVGQPAYIIGGVPTSGYADVFSVSEMKMYSPASLTDKSSTTDIFGDGSCKAFYRFEGNITDETGTYSGSATGTTYGTGKFGQGAITSGTTSNITLPSGLSTIFAGSFTVSLWVKFTSLRAGVLFRTCGSNTSGYFSMSTNASGYINANLYDGSTRPATSNYTNIATGVWYNAVVTRNAVTNMYDLYVNGSWIGNLANSFTLTVNTTIGLGNNPASSAEYIDGVFDNCRIFNRALTANEVATLYYEQAGAYSAVNRVYLGEAVTNGSAVTSVTNYALNGYYDSKDFTTTAVSTTVNHNLGVYPSFPQLFLNGATSSASITATNKTYTWTASAGTSRLIAQRSF